jgi:hypothetical protein
VGLSISESEESTVRGFPAPEVNRVTLRMVAGLLGQGVGVVFGHDWREDGVMEAVHRFALQMRPVDGSPTSAGPDGGTQPLLQNLIPWPDKPSRAQDALKRQAATLRVEQAGLPEELASYRGRARSDLSTDVYGYLRARALTHLRRQLDARCDARICLGGRLQGSKGRYPGVIEEALIAVESGTPLFLARALGGATGLIIDAMMGRPMSPDFCGPAEVHRLYRFPPDGVAEHDSRTAADRRVDRDAAWNAFREAGVSGLSRANRLTPEENAELFHTPVLDRVIQLVLVGMSRIQAPPRG